jgi:hypothetical protein
VRGAFGPAFSAFSLQTGRFARRSRKNLIAKSTCVKYPSLYEFMA